MERIFKLIVRTPLVAVIAAVLLIAIPAGACAASKTRTQKASGDGLVATLAYKAGDFHIDKDLHLKITDQAKQVFVSKVTGSVCKYGCDVLPHALAVAKLTADSSSPDVVLSLYSGGAHCCTVDGVYRKTTGGYRVSWHQFGDPGAKLKPIGAGGTSQFVTADDAFAYRFTDYAESGLPIKILSFSSGQFINVTRTHPALIRKNAKLWWKAYRSDHDSGRTGLLAAWVADEYNLGRYDHASTTLAAQVELHRITQGFVVQIKHFLKKEHYRPKVVHG